MHRLSDPVAVLGNLNAAQKRAVKAFDAKTIGDLVGILPRRYDDYTNTVAVRNAPLGEPVTLKVTVEKIANQPGFRKRVAIIRATVKDETGSLRVIWFNQPWLLGELLPGREIFLSGNITLHPQFGRQMGNPIWEDCAAAIAAGTVAPVYPLTGNVAQKTMRELMARVVEELEFVEDPLKGLGSRGKGTGTPSNPLPLTPCPLDQAIRFIHRPRSIAEAEQGRKRLAFDEFLTYRLALGSARKEADTAGAPAVAFDESFAKKFSAALPFPLTDDQKKAAWAAFQDMQLSRPMRRLLQGDVGSGKTVVAAFLMAMAYRSNQSAVLMAPTEILAQQHAKSLRRFLEIEGTSLLLLTSSHKILWEGGEETKLNLTRARERVAQGRVVVVGTHAVLERGMQPPDTALAVVDEQHRFGVAQRETLSVAPRPDGRVPHLLSMTATPIPRSLALTLYGDLAVSLIRTKPKGRAEIYTKVLAGKADGSQLTAYSPSTQAVSRKPLAVSQHQARDIAYQKIRDEVQAGHRAYVICPLIDPSDTLGVKSATDEAKRLAAGPLKGLRIGLLHGRLSHADKDGVMGAFVEGLLDVLVATTVVEVGVDVPEATVIAIEAAERFGLAQLHQLRGRVGRSSHPSTCFLLTDIGGGAPLDRLRVLERTNDGFVIAEEDLKRRGSGNLLGMQQSGVPTFRAAQATDLDLMAQAGETAEMLLKEDPELSHVPEFATRVELMRKTSHRE